MNPIRRLGMYVSLLLLSTVGFLRVWVSVLQGRKGSQGARIIIVDDRKVLLVAHWYAPWTWTLPGGGVDKSETPEQAAMREAVEETGLKVKSIAGEIGTYTGTLGKMDKVTVFYSGDFEGSLNMVPSFEIMARSWFDIDNLPPEISPANRRRIEAYRDGVRGERGRW